MTTKNIYTNSQKPISNIFKSIWCLAGIMAIISQHKFIKLDSQRYLPQP